MAGEQSNCKPQLAIIIERYGLNGTVIFFTTITKLCMCYDRMLMSSCVMKNN